MRSPAASALEKRCTLHSNPAYGVGQHDHVEHERCQRARVSAALLDLPPADQQYLPAIAMANRSVRTASLVTDN